ncbi:MAG: biotin/lipoyl-binding protein [Pseudomonadota bacterium]
MLEFTLCSLFTILPDYLYRYFVQGKRIGKEITLYSVWYELRYGITGCAILTVSLITVIFYYHPSTTNVTNFFRTVTILPEAGGRVTEIFVENGSQVTAGDPLFQLDDSSEQTAVTTAAAQIREVEASEAVAAADLATAQGQVNQAEGALEQAQDELDTRLELFNRGSNAVSERDVERLQNTVAERTGALEAAQSAQEAVQARIDTLIPAQRATAEAALDQAEAELSKKTVYAGTTGEVEQFALQIGDFVSPVLRPAGILVPDEAYRDRFQAGFGQISSQVIKPGMVGEITCVSHPFVIIPMVVVDVQEEIAAGQFRPGDLLVDLQDRVRPGTLLVTMEPLFPGDADRVPPGSRCAANVYTNNHDKLQDPEIGTIQYLWLHLVDTVGLMHALILRIQALLLPVQTLVFTGH